MARTIIRNSGSSESKPAAVKQTVKAAAAEGKKAQNVIEAQPTRGSATGYRIGAIVLWLLAIGCEILAIMAIMKDFVIKFTGNGNTNVTITLILFIVLDLIFAVIAAQLWKKANHIDPPSEKNKFLFYLQSELGVIMACICFIPLIIILLKNDKLDKKTKTIVTAVAAAALLITGFASADYNPISAEQKAEAEQVITEDVFWTTFGHKYHLNIDETSGCPHVRNSNTIYQGSVTEAIESGRTAICSYCASHFAEELGLDLEKLNVEGQVEEIGDVIEDLGVADEN